MILPASLLLVSLINGVIPLDIADLWQVLLHPQQAASELPVTHAVIWELRLPRAVMALLVGASLAVAGASLQGLFGNPLADPGIVGVSAGASLGAIAVIVLGLSTFGRWTLPIGAFASGFCTTWLIYFLARPSATGHDSSRLLLVGIAITAIAGAITGYLTYLASVEQLESLLFWSMGSLARSDWWSVGIVTPLVVLGVLMLHRQSDSLDLLALGERQAIHAGVDVPRLRLILISMTALLTAAAVAFSCTSGGRGRGIPHLVRVLVGPGHRNLLPLSALGGGALLMLADLGARSLDPPSEMPIGILTATLGGPFFLWLISRQARQAGER